MEGHPNYLAILVAAIANYALATVWMGGVEGGLMGGLFGWLGYIAPVTLATKVYEKKPWGLWFLDNGFWLVSLLVMGVILSVWM